MYSEAHEIAMRAKAEGYAEGLTEAKAIGPIGLLKEMVEDGLISADVAAKFEQKIKSGAGDLLNGCGHSLSRQTIYRRDRDLA